jgi:hypothetical protein
VLTHPASWGGYRLELLTQAALQGGLPSPTLLSEPSAAATFYASERPLAADALVAIYDLGGGTFDAAVVRRVGDGFTLLGTPQGLDRVGGMDIDEAVFAHVRAMVGDALDALDPDDPTAMSDVAELRQQCIEAKEALSEDSSTTIPVRLPRVRTDIRMTRDELNQSVAPLVTETISALHRAIESAGVTAGQLEAVLLVGGSSRLPLVAQMVGAEIGRPVAVNANPKLAVCLGAALHAARPATFVVPPTTAPPAPTSTAAAPPAWDVPASPPPVVPASPQPAPAPPPHGDGTRNRTLLLAAGAAAAVLLALVLFLVTRDDGKASVGTGTSTETTSDSTTSSDSSTDAPSTESSSSLTATEEIHFLPFRVDGTLLPEISSSFESTGSCFSSSNVTSRSDAYRCSSDENASNGANLFDPCFKGGGTFDDVTVACPLDTSGTNVALLHVGTSLNDVTPGDDEGTHPLLAVLSNGVECTPIASMQPQVGDLTFGFSCNDDTFATAPEGSGLQTVHVLDQNTNKQTVVEVARVVT